MTENEIKLLIDEIVPDGEYSAEKLNVLLHEILQFSKVEKGVADYSVLAEAPGATQDEEHLYNVGFIVKDLSTGIEYVCTDNTNGAAVWKPNPGQLIPYRIDLSAEDMIAGGDIEIRALPAVEGFAWLLDVPVIRYMHGSVVFTGIDEIYLRAVGYDAQFYAPPEKFLDGVNFSSHMLSWATSRGECLNSMVDSQGIFVKINGTITEGDGAISIIGHAKLIEL